MALPATDNFNGGTALQDLTAYNASWQNLIVDGIPMFTTQDGGAGTNQLRPHYASDWCIARWNADAFHANQYAFVTITAYGGGHLGVLLRGGPGAINSADGYGVRADGYITRYDDATALSGETVLASGLTTATNGDVLRGEVEGTTIRRFLDGVAEGSTTDATHASGSAGAWGYNSGDNFMDNWEGGNLAAAGNPWYAYAQIN